MELGVQERDVVEPVGLGRAMNVDAAGLLRALEKAAAQSEKI